MDYTSIITEIESAAVASEVVLISIDGADGITPVRPYTAIAETKPNSTDPNAPVPTSDATGTTVASAGETRTTSGSAPTATGALSKVIDGFYQVPLTITVQGDYEQVREFSDSLQKDSEHAILVSSVSLRPLREAPESESSPSAEQGDITYVLNSLAFVLEYDRTILTLQEGAEKPEEKVLPEPAKENLFAPSRKG